MNIWYVNHYSGGPGIGPAYRPFNLARAWRAQGQDASVIMARFHHLIDRETELPGRMTVEGIPYHVLPARHYKGNGLARIANMFDFCRGLSRLGKALPDDLRPPDAIIASSPHPFVAYPAAKLARRFGAKLVFEIRDIWPLSLIEVAGASKRHPFVMACRAAERHAYQRADLISSLLPRADRYLATAGAGHKPFVWVPNGVNVNGAHGEREACTTTDAALTQIAAWKAEGRVVVVHAGSMGPPNGLIELLAAINTPAGIERSRDFGILLVGSGVLSDQITRLAAGSPCEVRVLGRVPKSNVSAILKDADIGYCGLADRPTLYRYGVSLNKFGDYLGAGIACLLPITPCGDPVSESGGGIATAASSPQDLWAALATLIDLSHDERAQMGANGRAYMEREYDNARIAERYAEAISSLGR